MEVQFWILCTLLVLPRFVICHTSNEIQEVSMQYPYFVGSSHLRTGILNEDEATKQKFCEATYMFHLHYETSWNILPQIQKDVQLCNFMNIDFNEKIIENIDWNTYIRPTFIIQGVLQFKTNETRERQNELRSIGPELIREHCSNTMNYFINEQPVWGISNQLYLDLLFCVKQNYIPNLNVVIGKCKSIVTSAKSNKVPVRPANTSYVYGETFLRTELYKMDLDQLFLFCASTQKLMEEYLEKWNIKDQLIHDELACCLQLISRNIGSKDRLLIESSPPKLHIKGILYYNTGTAKDRISVLSGLPKSDLHFHCNTTKHLIQTYETDWQIWDQLILDSYHCKMLQERQQNEDFSFFNLNVTCLSELHKLSLDGLIKHCSKIGNYLQETWKIGSSNNSIVILHHSSVCMSLLSNYILCEGPESFNPTSPVEDNIFVRRRMTKRTWMDIRNMKTVELYKTCMEALTWLQFMQLDTYESEALSYYISACLIAFPGKDLPDSKWTETGDMAYSVSRLESFVIENNQLKSYYNWIPPCYLKSTISLYQFTKFSSLAGLSAVRFNKYAPRIMDEFVHNGHYENFKDRIRTREVSCNGSYTYQNLLDADAYCIYRKSPTPKMCKNLFLRMVRTLPFYWDMVLGCIKLLVCSNPEKCTDISMVVYNFESDYCKSIFDDIKKNTYKLNIVKVQQCIILDYENKNMNQTKCKPYHFYEEHAQRRIIFNPPSSTISASTSTKDKFSDSSTTVQEYTPKLLTSTPTINTEKNDIFNPQFTKQHVTYFSTTTEQYDTANVPATTAIDDNKNEEDFFPHVLPPSIIPPVIIPPVIIPPVILPPPIVNPLPPNINPEEMPITPPELQVSTPNDYSSTTQITSTTETTITTTEDTTTTEEPSMVCLFEPSIFFEPNPNRRSKRMSPITNLLLEDYPKFPLNSEKCRLNINEINTMHVPGTYEFLEFIKNCIKDGKAGTIPPNAVLQKYFVIIVNGSTNTIDFVANLNGDFKVRPNVNDERRNQLYFTLGNDMLGDSISMSFENNNVAYVSQDRTNVLPDGKIAANLVMLLFFEDRRIFHNSDKLKMPINENGKKEGIPLTDKLKKLLQNARQDCLVYGSSAFLSNCPVYQELCPELQKSSTNNYVLRDWENQQPAHESTDLSLSRCVSHAYPYDFRGFKLAPPTPGLENDCRNGIGILSELEIQDTFPLLVLPTTNEEVCKSDKDSILYQFASVSDYQRGIKRKQDAVIRDCMPGDLPHTRYGQMLTEMTDFNSYIRKMSTDQSYWWEKPCSAKVQRYLSQDLADLVDIDICKNQKVSWWLDIAEGPKPKLRCAVCHQFATEENVFKKPLSQKQTKLMTNEGYIGKNKRDNRNILLAHVTNQVHLDALDYVLGETVELNIKSIQEQIRALTPPRERNLRATENAFLVAAFRVQHNEAGKVYPQVTAFNIRYLNSNLGSTAISYYTYKSIVKSINDDFVEDLCRLINERNPMAMVADSYRKPNGISIIGVQIMLFKDGKPTLKTLGLIELSADHSSEGQFQVIDLYLQNLSPETQEAFFASLVAFTADGASVNHGVRKSILTKLHDRCGRKIPFQHCTSHKIQLALQQCFKDARFLYLGETKGSVPKVYDFFGSRSNRHELLLEKQKQNGKTPLSPKRYNVIRWANSLRDGLERILEIYVYIVDVTGDILNDRKSTDAVKRRAISLIQQLTCKYYIIALGFLLDVLNVFAKYSSISQTRGALLVDNIGLRKNLLSSINMLKNTDGPVLISIFQDTKNKNGGSPKTLTEFEAEAVSFRGIILAGLGTNIENHKLSILRQPYVDFVLESINKYFPSEAIDFLEVLDPKNFEIPEMVSTNLQQLDFDENYNFGVTNFTKVVNYLQRPLTASLILEWRKAIYFFVTDPIFPGLREMSPSEFWISALQRPSVPLSSNLKLIIQSVLVIPASSASVESLFSTVTHTLGNYRVGLSNDMLEINLRLKQEIPQDLDKWNVQDHVKSWLQKGHILVDENKPGQNLLQATNADDEEFEDIEIYEPVEDVSMSNL